jgi:autotransporter-associated beta strand protein
VLSASNSYSGNTTIAAGTLQLGAGGQLPAGTNLAINGNSFGVVSGTLASPNNASATGLNHQDGVFDLNGQNQTVAGLTGLAGTGGGAVGIVTNSATGTSTLTHTGSSTFDGIIRDGGSGRIVALTKTTGGVLTLTGSNNFTGATSVTGGTLLLANSNALAGSSFAGGGGSLSFGSLVAATFGGLQGVLISRCPTLQPPPLLFRSGVTTRAPLIPAGFRAAARSRNSAAARSRSPDPTPTRARRASTPARW